MIMTVVGEEAAPALLHTSTHPLAHMQHLVGEEAAHPALLDLPSLALVEEQAVQMPLVRAVVLAGQPWEVVLHHRIRQMRLRSQLPCIPQTHHP